LDRLSRSISPTAVGCPKASGGLAGLLTQVPGGELIDVVKATKRKLCEI
jgi:hypothetical protein